MKIDEVAVGYLKCNCYILDIDNHVLIIDPGDDVDKIIKKIGNRKVIGIIITHHHFDHVGALEEILNYKKVMVYDSKLKEGNYNIAGFNIEVIHTEGHTSDSVSYYFKDYNIMFVGDFIFEGSIGRCDLPTGDINKMNESINKIKKYNDDIILYPGHGNKTTLGIEKKTNYYFT